MVVWSSNGYFNVLMICIISDINECESSPCGVYGTCTDGHDRNNYYTCVCVPGYTGINCEKG